MIHSIASLLAPLREKKPLVHHITNAVTINDCANITLGIGASPIMADAPEEAAEIAALASAVVLNMGTLNERTVSSMFLAGKAANENSIPVVFDPVGAGASSYRNATAHRMLDELSLCVLRGNLSEIRFLAGVDFQSKGVDASEADLFHAEEASDLARKLANRLGCTVAITGAVDVVTDGKCVLRIENGHPMLSHLTGTGCMCSSLIGSFCAAQPDDPLFATAAALLSMGIAGEIAYEKAGASGNGSFRTTLHDAISRMDASTMERSARLHEA